jgi:hypothetical protein
VRNLRAHGWTAAQVIAAARQEDAQSRGRLSVFSRNPS